MGAGDGALAWEYLRRNPNYRDAWEAATATPVFEKAPFPLRVQTEADLATARFALLAWADPEAADGEAGGGAVSPFWAEAPMLRGKLSSNATPLLALLDGAGARLEGLRLADGCLVLKVERGGRALQIRVEGKAALRPERGGVEIRHDWGLGLAYSIDRLKDLWSVSEAPDPRSGQGRRAVTGSCCGCWTGAARGSRSANWRRSSSARGSWRRNGIRTATCARGSSDASPGRAR